MKCFYDPSQDAIGICKSCGKGLSTDYAVDLGRGLACKNRCEADVRALTALIEGNLAMQATGEKLILGSGRGGMIGSTFMLLMGIAFASVGVVYWEKRGFLPFILGLLFFAWGIANFLRSYALHRTVAKIPPQQR